MRNTQTSRYDAILVGSGINSLVAAALLAKAGRAVLVLEREPVLGGCIRTEELTLPGFLHDTLATAHPLFVLSPGYQLLGPELHKAGLEYCKSETPTGTLFPDGSFQTLSTSRQKNVATFEKARLGDGHAYGNALESIQANAELIFALLGNELWRSSMLKTLGKSAWTSGLHELTVFFGGALVSCSHWLNAEIKGEGLKGLLAPWTLHTGLGPDSAASALMAKVIAFSLEAVGIPLVKGGNYQTVEAFIKLISDGGGKFRTNSHVERIEIVNGIACGVVLKNGEKIYGKDIICNVTPTQLYGQLIPEDLVPAKTKSDARSFRYGRGNMQIHLALSEMPRWEDNVLADVTYLHLSGGLDAVSKAVNEAERGLLPADPTICIAQPSSVDASRAPPGSAVLWIQLPECPRVVKGDAAGIIPTSASGVWTTDIAEAYADRVIGHIAKHVPNLNRSILARKVVSPADLEKMNINLVGGDPYAGACDLDQSFLWRPLRSTKNHSTFLSNLWHIGASTHPGPGLGGNSGYLVAKSLGAA